MGEGGVESLVEYGGNLGPGELQSGVWHRVERYSINFQGDCLNVHDYEELKAHVKVLFNILLFLCISWLLAAKTEISQTGSESWRRSPAAIGQRSR